MKIVINIGKKHLLIITLILVISAVTFVLAQTPGVSHHAAEITAGVFDVARIPNLDTSKINSGEFVKERIPTTLRSTTISGNLEVTGNTKLNCQIVDNPSPPSISCTTKCANSNKICLFAEGINQELKSCDTLGSLKCLCC